MKNNGDEILFCPNCGSKEIAVTVEQMFMVNNGEHYCHAVKAHDSNANIDCLACGWKGMRFELVNEWIDE